MGKKSNTDVELYEVLLDKFQKITSKMKHKNVTTTQEYLRFQADEIKDNFPSLIPIIESMENMQKSGSMVTKSMVTEYSNDNKLYGSHRE